MMYCLSMPFPLMYIQPWLISALGLIYVDPKPETKPSPSQPPCWEPCCRFVLYSVWTKKKALDSHVYCPTSQMVLLQNIWPHTCPLCVQIEWKTKWKHGGIVSSILNFVPGHITNFTTHFISYTTHFIIFAHLFDWSTGEFNFFADQISKPSLCLKIAFFCS